MSVESRAVRAKQKRRNAQGDPDFMTKSQLAHAMGDVDTATIDKWVAAGTVPPAWVHPGQSTALWLRRHYVAYRESRSWPAEAFGPGDDS